MKSRFFDAWALTAAAAVLMAITMGSRSAFGLFVSPLNTATGLGLATISLAGALSQLGWGLAQPFVGAAADRYGAARVIGAGGIVAAVATALVTVADSASGLLGAFALLACASAAMGSGALLLAVVNRDAPPSGGVWPPGSSAPAHRSASWCSRRRCRRRSPPRVGSRRCGGSRRSRCWRCRSRASSSASPPRRRRSPRRRRMQPRPRRRPACATHWLRRASGS